MSQCASNWQFNCRQTTYTELTKSAGGKTLKKKNMKWNTNNVQRAKGYMYLHTSYLLVVPPRVRALSERPDLVQHYSVGPDITSTGEAAVLDCL